MGTDQERQLPIIIPPAPIPKAIATEAEGETGTGTGTEIEWHQWVLGDWASKEARSIEQQYFDAARRPSHHFMYNIPWHVIQGGRSWFHDNWRRLGYVEPADKWMAAVMRLHDHRGKVGEREEQKLRTRITKHQAEIERNLRQAASRRPLDRARDQAVRLEKELSHAGEREGQGQGERKRERERQERREREREERRGPSDGNKKPRRRSKSVLWEFDGSQSVAKQTRPRSMSGSWVVEEGEIPTTTTTTTTAGESSSLLGLGDKPPSYQEAIEGDDNNTSEDDDDDDEKKPPKDDASRIQGILARTSESTPVNITYNNQRFVGLEVFGQWRNTLSLTTSAAPHHSWALFCIVALAVLSLSWSVRAWILSCVRNLAPARWFLDLTSFSLLARCNPDSTGFTGWFGMTDFFCTAASQNGSLPSSGADFSAHSSSPPSSSSSFSSPSSSPSFSSCHGFPILNLTLFPFLDADTGEASLRHNWEGLVPLARTKIAQLAPYDGAFARTIGPLVHEWKEYDLRLTSALAIMDNMMSDAGAILRDADTCGYLAGLLYNMADHVTWRWTCLCGGSRKEEGGGGGGGGEEGGGGIICTATQQAKRQQNGCPRAISRREEFVWNVKTLFGAAPSAPVSYPISELQHEILLSPLKRELQALLESLDMLEKTAAREPVNAFKQLWEAVGALRASYDSLDANLPGDKACEADLEPKGWLDFSRKASAQRKRDCRERIEMEMMMSNGTVPMRSDQAHAVGSAAVLTLNDAAVKSLVQWAKAGRVDVHWWLTQLKQLERQGRWDERVITAVVRKLGR
ncbi:hypothetical protein MKZ38_006181 [Zalerion maritima]|uniref:Uncharacterized protein n=1 Tax=Zalerion maritima TaxID=339359 RepID=A0AAD5RK71_9PEZI|nr:hypothetical protein MKZ38_006181 [Zalerion maritima]